MNPEVCIDANIAVKWYTFEQWKTEALALLEECSTAGFSMIAPDFMLSEVSSSIIKHLRKRSIQAETAWVSISLLMGLDITSFDIRGLYGDAWRIVQEYHLPVIYDACYLALAEQHGCTFWTADERLINCLHGDLPYVKHIRDFVPGMLGEK